MSKELVSSNEYDEFIAKEIKRMSEEILDNYKGAWAYATTDQLIEELEIVYKQGVKGLQNMDYLEITREYEEQE
tara:strand:- start:2246 stop:2467 length:222 start_codon:yes stop_codon:yes gene_type:complete